MTPFIPFDEQGNMIRSGRACTAKKGVVSAGRAEAAQIGKEILEKGGNATCILNGANEVAVAAFLEDRIRFTDIPAVIAQTLERCQFVAEPDLDAIYSTDFEAKRLAAELIERKY